MLQRLNISRAFRVIEPILGHHLVSYFQLLTSRSPFKQIVLSQHKNEKREKKEREGERELHKQGDMQPASRRAECCERQRVHEKGKPGKRAPHIGHRHPRKLQITFPVSKKVDKGRPFSVRKSPFLAGTLHAYNGKEKKRPSL